MARSAEVRPVHLLSKVLSDHLQISLCVKAKTRVRNDCEGHKQNVQFLKRRVVKRLACISSKISFFVLLGSKKKLYG